MRLVINENDKYINMDAGSREQYLLAINKITIILATKTNQEYFVT